MTDANPLPPLPSLPQGAPAPEGELLVDLFDIPAHQGIRGACPKCGQKLETDEPRAVRGVAARAHGIRVNCGKCGTKLSVHLRMVQLAR